MNRNRTRLAVLAIAMVPALGWAQAQSAEMRAGFDVEIAADGRVTAVRPDDKVPVPIRDLLIRRVAEWRYEPAKWQGKAVASANHTILRLGAVPTTQGGYALRILGMAGETLDDGSKFGMSPPKYPPEAQRRSAVGTFHYQVNIDREGRTTGVRLLVPEEAALDSSAKRLDRAAQEAIREWRIRPAKADGEPVACSWISTMSFSVGDKPAPRPEEIDALKSLLPDPCPMPELRTKIEGLIL